MKKVIYKKDQHIGQLVVVTEHPETQVYTIAGYGNQDLVILQWFEGTKLCSQGHSAYDLVKPTIDQIEYSIANNGRLVSTDDIVEWA